MDGRQLQEPPTPRSNVFAPNPHLAVLWATSPLCGRTISDLVPGRKSQHNVNLLGFLQALAQTEGDTCGLSFRFRALTV